jgi:integrase
MTKIEEKIKEYLEDNFTKQATKYSYKSHLKSFFLFLNIDPATYFETKRDYQEDVKQYWKYLMTAERNGRPYAPKSIPPKMSCIKVFLEEHDIVFNPRFWRKLSKRGKGNEPIREDRIPKIDELKAILSHARIHEKAFFMVMLSSGARETELCNITLDDINLDSTPNEIKIRGLIAKNKKTRITFITNEARDALMQWLKVRNDYIKQNALRFKALKSHLEQLHKKEIVIDNENRVFPFFSTRMRKRWNILLEKTGLNEKDKATDSYILHCYTLRKFFNTRLKEAVPEHIVEKLMGHSGYLNGAYDRYTNEDLAKYYMQGWHMLNVFEKPANEEDTLNIKNQMESLQQQVKDLLKQTAFYRENIVEPISEEPIMSDKDAVKEYEKQKETIKEIKEDGMELWGMRQRGKAKLKQKK